MFSGRVFHHHWYHTIGTSPADSWPGSAKGAKKQPPSFMLIFFGCKKTSLSLGGYSTDLWFVRDKWVSALATRLLAFCYWVSISRKGLSTPLTQSHVQHRISNLVFRQFIWNSRKMFLFGKHIDYMNSGS